MALKRRPRFKHTGTTRNGGLGAVRSNTVRAGNILRIPETSTASGVSLAGGRAAAAVHPDYSATKPLPPDPGYDGQVGAIDNTETNTVAGLRGDRARTLQDYGYTANFDANDNLVAGSLAFDPTNVFSRAALLLKKYREAKAGNTNTLASAGQLNSGAYGRQQRLINFNESQGQDALSKGIMDFLARNQSSIAGAHTSAEFARGTAMGDRITRAQDNPLYDPTTPVSTPGGTGPRTSATSTAGPEQYDALGRLITAAGNGRPSIVYDAKKGGYWHIYADGRKVFVKKK